MLSVSFLSLLVILGPQAELAVVRLADTFRFPSGSKFKVKKERANSTIYKTEDFG